MKEIAYSRQAIKALRSMQKSRREAIIAKIEMFASGQTVDARQMQGTGFIRIRVGQWRIILDDNGAVLDVLKIGPRGDVYK